MHIRVAISCPLVIWYIMCSAAAAWRGERGGAVVAFGTAAAFDGEALQRPGNAAACDLLFRWLRPVRSNLQYSCGALCVMTSQVAAFTALSGQLPTEPAPCALVRSQWAHTLLQGSDVDLGLPPVEESTSRARRRPLDIVEQSEQPRVCFQVAADAQRWIAAVVVAVQQAGV
jgi:hypothetical protein